MRTRGSLSAALATLAALSLSTFASSRAYAQDASSQAAAQALFEQARQLMADGKYAEACPKLVESQRLDPGAGTLVNLGACYEKNGQTASAWVTFKDAAAAADLKHRADWSQRARERAAALEPQLSKLTIDVRPEARAGGLQVRRDGVEVGAAEWGTPIPVDPGDHAVDAVAPAKKHWTTMVHVGPTADQAHVAVPVLEDDPAPSAAVVAPIVTPTPPQPAAPPSTEPPPPPSPDGSTQRTVGLIVGGVGIVGLGIGTIFGVVAMGKESDSKNLCPTTSCSNAAAVSDNNDAKSAATISTVGIVAGAALVATGVVVYLTAPKRRSPVALHLVPAMGAGQIGLNLGGAW